MPSFDDRLTRELDRAARPADPGGVFEEVERRRRRRSTARRWQAAAVAVAVVAGTASGFVALSRAFGDGDPRTGGDPQPLAANGQIVFSAEGPDGHRHLYAIQPDGSGRRQITDFGTEDTDPAVSPDGRTIAFVHQLEEAPPAIATIPIEGGVVTWLTDADFFVTDGPTWSPDGGRIAFAARHGEGQRIYVMDANGRDPHPITGDDVHWPEAPSWSPDGSTIAFAASPISGDEEPSVWDIYTVRPDGTDLVNVTESPTATSDESSPTWSPDGELIAFSREDFEGTSIVVRDVSTGSESTAVLGDGSHANASPSWSPDGRLIAYTRHRIGDATHVWLVRPDGTAAARLTTGVASEPSWQPVAAGGVSPTPEPTTDPQPSASSTPSASPSPGAIDIGLAFQLCHATQMEGVDFLGDGSSGIAWVGTRAQPNGTCPDNFDDPYGVAADFNGDGIADSWSGETIAYCGDCEPLRAIDLNGDGREELIVVLQYFSIMQYGVYTVLSGGGAPQVVPFRVGEPGHPQHSLQAGKPFSFWVGGDAGATDWLYCESLPTLWLTATETPVEPTPGDVTSVHETQVSLETDGIAHILYAETYTVPADAQPELRYASPDHSEPDCGIGVNDARP